MRIRFAVFAAAVMVLALGQAVAAQVSPANRAANSTSSTSDVFVFNSDQVVVAAASTLTRTVNGITATFDTNGLMPTHVYTMWWAIFNQPQHCVTSPCSLDDLLNNPSVAPSLVWATGAVVTDPYGQAHFSANLVPNNPDGPVVFGPGLLNPLRAEVHAVIRTHGEASVDPGTLSEQITTFNGGCPPNACANVQASIHLP